MSGTPECRYVLDAAYLRTSEARAVVLRPRWIRWAFLGLIVAVLGILAWNGRDRPAQTSLSLGLVVLFTLFLLWRDRHKRFQRFRGTPLENAELRVVLGPDGFDVEGPSIRSHDAWSSVSKARAFDDGLRFLEGGAR